MSYSIYKMHEKHLRARYSVEGTGLVLNVRVEVRPKFDKKEGVLRSLVVELLQATLLLREFVVYLPNVYCLSIKLNLSKFYSLKLKIILPPITDRRK